MNYLSLFYLTGALYCLGLGCFVLGKNPSSNTAKAFFLQTLFAFIWQIGTFFVLSAHNEKSAFLFARLTYLGAIFIPCATYHLIVNFLQLDKQKLLVWLAYFLGGIIFILSIESSLFISGVYKYSWGFWFKAGPLHPLYLIFFIVVALTAFINLSLSQRQKTSDIEKRKRRFLFYAYLIAYLGVVDFLPDYGLDILPLGFLSIIIFLSAICYMLKYYDFIESFNLQERPNICQP